MNAGQSVKFLEDTVNKQIVTLHINLDCELFLKDILFVRMIFTSQLKGDRFTNLRLLYLHFA